MDNKITKNRLSDLLAYDWLKIILFSVVFIVVFELLFTVTGVRLTAGQKFKVFYDQKFSSSDTGKLYNLIRGKLSYDVIETDFEKLYEGAETSILDARLSIQEGDVIITDSLKPDEESQSQRIRAREIIDNYPVYSLEKLLSDGKDYLKRFLKDGEDDELNFENLDIDKINANFLRRMKKDNRFRSEEQKNQGKILEQARIQNLCKDISDFEKILNCENQDLFYRYTKYEQIMNSQKEGTNQRKTYQDYYNRECSEGRENAVYGLNLFALTGGKTQTENYFKIDGKTDTKDCVLLVFNFLNYQEDLQFECISFICTVVRECSSILG